MLIPKTLFSVGHVLQQRVPASKEIHTVSLMSVAALDANSTEGIQTEKSTEGRHRSVQFGGRRCRCHGLSSTAPSLPSEKVSHFHDTRIISSLPLVQSDFPVFSDRLPFEGDADMRACLTKTMLRKSNKKPKTKSNRSLIILKDSKQSRHCISRFQ